MIYWDRITGFGWDEGNARKSEDKHGVSQAETERVFFNEPLLLFPDQRHSQHEPRYHALGRTDTHRLLHVTFTLSAGERLIRIISARDMHRSERRFYERTEKDRT